MHFSDAADADNSVVRNTFLAYYPSDRWREPPSNCPYNFDCISTSKDEPGAAHVETNDIKTS